MRFPICSGYRSVEQWQGKMTDTDTTTSATPSFLGNIDPSKVKKPENTDKLDAIRKKVVELRDL